MGSTCWCCGALPSPSRFSTRSEVSRRFFDQLDAPVACLASLDVPTSVSRVLEAAVIIGDEQIVDQVEAVARRRWQWW